MRHVGRSLERLVDISLVTGRARFVGDIARGRELNMRLVRSPVAFGRLRGIDSEAAAAQPGIVALWTAADVATVPPIPLRTGAALTAYLQPVLARDYVRFVGEPVAAIFAESAAAAEDAAELIGLDIEPLEPLLTASSREFASADDRGGSRALTLTKAAGHLHRAFDQASRIVERRVSLARSAALPLETRGVLADWDAGEGTLTLAGSAKVLSWNRDTLAELLDLPISAVEFAPTFIGGAFGVRGELGPEDVLACLATRALGWPVRWSEEQHEHLLAASQGRGIEAIARAAVNEAGVVLGLDVEMFIDQGAYLRPDGLLAPELATALLPRPYAIDAFRVRAHVRMTNRTPCGSVRGAGRSEATFVRERLFDAVAAELALGPLELRRRNLVGAPQTAPEREVALFGAPLVEPGTTGPDLIDVAGRRFDLDGLARQVAERRAGDELVGLGTALFAEPCAAGPQEKVTLALDRGGNVTLATAVSDFGQGIETGLRQIVADILGADYAKIRVLTGRSDRSVAGPGSVLGRSLAAAGTAAQLAAEDLREQVLSLASVHLRVPQDRLLVRAGTVRDAGDDADPGICLAALARSVDDQPGLWAEGLASAAGVSLAHGVHVAIAEVDPLTGLVSVPATFLAYDVGNAINPRLVDGQLAGGVLHGITQALCVSPSGWEGGEAGALDYGELDLPTLAEMPRVETLVSGSAPAETNPLGLKGVGGAGTNGMGAAIAAAVDAALGAPGFVSELPIRPERVRAYLRGRGIASGPPRSKR